jgi:hypothetical protein
MNSDFLLAQHRRFINAGGEDVLVRRYTGAAGSARPKTDTAARARVVGDQRDQVVGSIQVGDSKVIMLVDTLGGLLPLTLADKVVIRGTERAIKSIDDNTRRYNGVLIALEIQVAG